MATDYSSLELALSDTFGDSILEKDSPFGFLTYVIEPSKTLEILRWLKEHAEYRFIYLTDITAVHMPEQAGKEIGVVYHLHSLENNLQIRLKAWLPESNPAIETATSLWSGANWMERETYDFFGVNFTGHPDLRRILNVDHMEMFPMLKQYPLEDSTREDKDDRFFGR